MNKLTVDDRIKVSGMLESYSAIHKKRLTIVGKLYGSKKNQLIDANLKEQQKAIDNRFQEILTNY